MKMQTSDNLRVIYYFQEDDISPIGLRILGES